MDPPHSSADDGAGGASVPNNVPTASYTSNSLEILTTSTEERKWEFWESQGIGDDIVNKLKEGPIDMNNQVNIQILRRIVVLNKYKNITMSFEQLTKEAVKEADKLKIQSDKEILQQPFPSWKYIFGNPKNIAKIRTQLNKMINELNTQRRHILDAMEARARAPRNSKIPQDVSDKATRISSRLAKSMGTGLDKETVKPSKGKSPPQKTNRPINSKLCRSVGTALHKVSLKNKLDTNIGQSRAAGQDFFGYLKKQKAKDDTTQNLATSSKSENALDVWPVLGPCKDPTVKCSFDEALKHFDLYEKYVLASKKPWRLQHQMNGSNSSAISTIVPPEHMDQLHDLLVRGRNYETSINSQLLLEGFGKAWEKGCKTFFDQQAGQNKCKIINLGTAGNAILNEFIREMKNGIILPAINIKYNIQKAPSHSTSALDDNDDPVSAAPEQLLLTASKVESALNEVVPIHVINSIDIPAPKHLLFQEFMGKALDDPWIHFQGQTLTYRQGLELLPGAIISESLYDVLISKLLQTLLFIPPTSPNPLLTWSEIEQLTNAYEANTLQSPNQPHRAIIDRYNQIENHLYFTLTAREDNSFGFGIISKTERKIRLFFTMMANYDFMYWTFTTTSGLEVKQRLSAFKNVLSELEGRQEDNRWCRDVEVWPDMATSLMIKVTDAAEPTMGPIHCTLALHKILIRDAWYEKTKPQGRLPSDTARDHYFKLLNNSL